MWPIQNRSQGVQYIIHNFGTSTYLNPVIFKKIEVPGNGAFSADLKLGSPRRGPGSKPACSWQGRGWPWRQNPQNHEHPWVSSQKMVESYVLNESKLRGIVCHLLQPLGGRLSLKDIDTNHIQFHLSHAVTSSQKSPNVYYQTETYWNQKPKNGYMKTIWTKTSTDTTTQVASSLTPFEGIAVEGRQRLLRRAPLAPRRGAGRPAGGLGRLGPELAVFASQSVETTEAERPIKQNYVTN